MFESKYLGIVFSASSQDDTDMLRQMRLLYAKSNKLLRMFNHCSIDVKITYLIVIALHYIVLICGRNIGNRLIAK